MYCMVWNLQQNLNSLKKIFYLCLSVQVFFIHSKVLKQKKKDSLAKIKVDFDNQNLTKDPDEPFEEIIKIPKRLQAAVCFQYMQYLFPFRKKQ